MENSTDKKFWFQTPAFRIGLGVFVAIAVVAVVLFSKQISQLLDLFGSKAAEVKMLILSGEPIEGELSLSQGTSPDGSIFFDAVSGKLKLTPPTL